MRPDLADARPRLFLTASDLPRLRQRLADPRVQRFYKPASVLTRKPPEFKPGKRNGGAFRTLGDYALSHLLAPEDAKIEAILRWLEMATTYPHCGVDLDAEYFIEGVALAYDWLYDAIPEDLRLRVRDTIARQCRELYQASLVGRTGGGLSFQQNHYWYAHLALALGAAAVYGEVPEAESWLAWAWDRFERIMLSFSPDGSFHEGPSYWDFSMPTLYIFIDLYEQCTGKHIPDGDNGLRGQGRFRFYHLYPGLTLSAALEDTSIVKGRPPRDLMLWEAKRFADPVANGIAALLSPGPERSCWNLLWLDETVGSHEPLDELPFARHFRDVETVFARTSWSSDATALAFVSRPLGGHRWAELCTRFGLGGTGHNHPEQSHFVLFGRGEVLVADPGYTYAKQTRNHNTVLVDGKGQFGDGQMWPGPTPGRAHVTQFITDGDITIVTGDATSAYPAELGLTRFERTLVLAGRDLVVVCDRLTSAVPRSFSWLLHHYGETANTGNAWTIRRGAAQLSVMPRAPANLSASATTYRPQFIHPTRNLTPKEPDIGLLTWTTEPCTATTFLVPLVIGTAGDAAPDIEDASTDTADAIRVGQVVVAFSRGDGAMAVQTPWGEPITGAAQTVVARVKDGVRQVVRAPAVVDTQPEVGGDQQE